MKVYRVENQNEQHGIWRNFDGTLNPVFSLLSDGLARSLPMDDSDFYREDGKQWFSACDNKHKLRKWFSCQDVVEMLAMGYEVFEFEVDRVRIVSNYEVVFTRESISHQRVIDPRSIWGDECTYPDTEPGCDGRPCDICDSVCDGWDARFCCCLCRWRYGDAEPPCDDCDPYDI